MILSFNCEDLKIPPGNRLPVFADHYARTRARPENGGSERHKDRRLFVRDPRSPGPPERSHRSIENLAPSPPVGYRPDHRSAVENKAIYPDAATLQRLFAVANHDPAARKTIIRTEGTIFDVLMLNDRLPLYRAGFAIR
jgi:hypothetical protein